MNLDQEVGVNYDKCALAVGSLTCSAFACNPIPDPGLADLATGGDAAADIATDADPPDVAPDTPPEDVEPDIEPDAGPPLVIDPAWHDNDVFQVGTFNIDWLWDTYGGEFTSRNEVDYAQIASLIRAIDIEVLALQEINGEGALELLGLPRVWEWTVGYSGWSQNLAVLVRSDRARILSAREVRLPSNDFPAKEPLVVEIERLDDGSVWWLVVLHLHPFTDPESVSARMTQSEEVAAWLDEAVDGAGEPIRDRAIVLGDINDTREGISDHGPAAGPLLEHPDLVVASDACEGGTTLDFESRIDHILLGESAAAAWQDAGETCAIVRHDELSPWSDYEGGWRSRPTVSTHRPIFVTLSARD